MKVIRYLAVLLSLSVVLMLQGCGDETGGALTMTALTKVDNGDGTYAVSTKITYVPPTGKSAEGVKVTVNVTGVVVTPFEHTFTSGSNSFDYSVNVPQIVGASNYISIGASIGNMNASAGTTIPGFTFPALAVPTATASFSSTAVAGASQGVAFTGGTAPFAFISSDPTVISATINPTAGSLTGGGTVFINLLTANPAGASTTATVTLTDSNGGAVPITVTYFK